MADQPPVFTTPRPFGNTAAGEEALLYCLNIPGVMTALITNYGGILNQIWTPDCTGKMADVTLGFNSLADYESHSPYFGALIGRVGNRISKAGFDLGEHSYTLANNNAPGGHPCHLHGGLVGFDKAVWKVTRYRPTDHPILVLEHVSPAGDEGYPGTLKATVTYRITPEGALSIEYEATTDALTLVNMTNHAYFNLRGEGQGDVLDHRLQIAASAITEVDAGLIPTGEFLPVEGTPFDFREEKPIGADIEAPHDQLKFGGGYDHNFVLDGEKSSLRHVATVREPTTGRRLETYTTEPGIQLYTGNFLDGSFSGKSGQPYGKHGAFCLETQHYPDSPHNPHFPPITLQPDDLYRTQTIYQFMAEKP